MTRENAMVRNHLEGIRSKESEAKQMILEARARASAIVEKAREEGEKLLEETQIEGVELRKTMVAGAGDAAQSKIEELREAGGRNLRRIEASVSGRRSQAIEMIMEAFRGGLRDAGGR